MRLLLLLSLLALLPRLCAADPFIMQIDTSIAGGSGVGSFILPLSPAYAYNFTVDWGDGNTQVVTTATNPLHSYASAGLYLVSITENVVGGFPTIYFYSEAAESPKLRQITHWGSNTWVSMHAAFIACSNLTITATDQDTAKTGAITDFSFAWDECTGLTSFPVLDTSGGTFFDGTWYDCIGLTSFPILNTSHGTSFQTTWDKCMGLTTFPVLDTSAGTNFSWAWYGCSGLASFPVLDTSKGTSFSTSWAECTGLINFPLLNTSHATDLSSAWANDGLLSSFPALATGNVTTFADAWAACSGLTSFPLIDTSAGTDFSTAWELCSGLTSFPAVNTALGTNFSYTWYGCTGLTSFPPLDLGSMTMGYGCFSNVMLPTNTYSDVLISLAASNTNTRLYFDGGNSHYNSRAVAARAALTGAPRLWTILDQGLTPSPVISAITPVAGTQAGGTLVSISGTDLTGTSRVTFGGLAATAVTVVSDSVVTCISPADTPGTVDIVLTTPADEVTDSAAFTYEVFPVISSSLTVAGTVGSPFTYQIAASGSPTSFAASGLPAGLTIDASTGLISGTPTAIGTSPVGLSATNVNGSGTATLMLTMNAAAGGGSSSATAPGTGGSTGGSGSGGSCGLGSGMGVIGLASLGLWRVVASARPRPRPTVHSQRGRRCSA